MTSVPRLLSIQVGKPAVQHAALPDDAAALAALPTLSAAWRIALAR